MKLFRLQPEKRSGLTDSGMVQLLSGGTTAAGVSVTSESAMRSTAVLAAIRVLSESIASLPLIVYKRDGQAKQRAPEHPLYRILHDQANPDMTAYSLRRLQVQHLAQYGNSYCEIEWAPNGKPMALWPLHPSRVGVERQKDTGAIQYTYYSDKAGGVVLPAWRVFHLRWLESDGIVGQSPIKLAARAVGLGMAMEEFAGNYFANGARPSIVLKHPGALTLEGYERLRSSFADAWAGLGNAYRPQILEEGMDVSTVGVPPEESQLLEARKFQVNEIARIFRVPPHLIGDLERSTNNNIEHQGIEFLQFTLMPMLVSIEAEIRRQLMTPGELGQYDVEHVVDGLLRGDSTTRWEVYTKAYNIGAMSPNEIRALENMNPIDGGDVYYRPMNLAPINEPATPQDQQQDQQQDQPQDQQPDQPVDSGARFAPLYRDVAQRIVRRETNDLRRAVDKYLRKRSASEFIAYLDEFYKDLAESVPGMYRALSEAVAGDDAAQRRQLASDINELVAEYSNRNWLRLSDLVNNDTQGDPAAAVEEWLSEWQESGVEWLMQRTPGKR